ncbi:MAG: hypothetical protein Unbinned2716contig1000_14 [Prokaryotic dsDNA virus sp.]|nr:MAG: hypothetical protein Unbinned2716contig1000_14 [Prokaryotic dsDNA virus sp.]|tara:strand:+ start:24128 stop:28102 length:3975 start_codon:yes stop_codon:yes gene_type:complete
MAEHQVSIELYEEGTLRDERAVIGSLDLMVGTDLPLAMTFQVKDINNLDENTASFTKTFDIPATRNNNRVLQEAFSDNLVDYQKFVGDKIKCTVKVNGMTILVGSFQITSTIGREKIEAYTVTILGDANNWVARFETPMCETEWDMDNDKYNDDDEGRGHYIFSSNLWKNINDNVINSDDFNWCMPHICWGEYNHIQTNGAQTRAKMWLEDNVPSIFIKPLVEKYFNEIGYTLKSDFMNTDYFKKLCFPLDYAYFKHGYGQEPVFHIEARFEPPNPDDAMWKDLSENGFQNKEMFGMFALARFGDRHRHYSTQYADPNLGMAGPKYDNPTSQWYAGSNSNFQNWGAYDIIGGSDYTPSGLPLDSANWNPVHTRGHTNNPSITSKGHMGHVADGRNGLTHYDGKLYDGNTPWPDSMLAFIDDNDPDTARDGTLNGTKLHQGCNRVPFNHTIYDNGKGNLDVSGGNRWATEALVNFQPPFGEGGGGYDTSLATLSSGAVYVGMGTSCGTFESGVEFVSKGGDARSPYYITYPTHINNGYGWSYANGSAWYGVYNGWGWDITGFSSTGNLGPSAGGTNLGESQWNRSIDNNGNVTFPVCPMISLFDGTLYKYNGPHPASILHWHNDEGDVCEHQTRKRMGAAFFNWVAPKEGKYRIEVLVPLMHYNKQLNDKNRPIIRILKAGIEDVDIQDVEVLAQRTVNFKPQYDQGFDQMVYSEVEMDTGYFSCDAYDRVWVDISLPASRSLSFAYKNQAIMLSSEFSRRLNSVTATDPFLWDDYCLDPNDPQNANHYPKAGKIIHQTFPKNTDTGQFEIPNGYFKAYQDNKVRHMDKFVLRDMLPCDVSKMEFVSGLTGLFNLHWHTDELSKTITVEPFDTFYTGKENAEDWTNKKDYNVGATTTFMVDRLAKKIKFAYQEDGSDEVVDVVSERQGQHWHSHEIELSSRFLNEEIILGTSLFGPTFMFEDFELNYNFSGGAAPWIPLICPEFAEDMGYLTPKPEAGDGFLFRLLSYEGMQPVGTSNTCYGSWNWNVAHPTTGNMGDVSTYPQAVSWHKNSSTAPNLSYSLSKNFGSSADNFEQHGLYHTYWRNMMTMLASAPRMKTVQVYLTPADIAKLNLRNIVHMTEAGGANASYWIVSKIVDYQPHMDVPTVVELIQYQIQTTDIGTIAHADDTTTFRWETAGNSGGGSGSGTAAISGGNPTVPIIQSPNQQARMINNGTLVQRNAGNQAPVNSGIAMLGSNLQARRQGQICLGQYNRRDDDAIFVVGGGTSENDRRNILTIRESGEIVVGDSGGGMNMVTTDSSGNYVDLFTEIKQRGSNEITVTKVIK